MSTLDEIFPPKTPTWTTVDIPDLTGNVYIVTGGNSGIGKETVKQLLKKGGKVYMASRSRERAEEAIAELETETGGKRAIFLKLDLADLASVRHAAEEYASKETLLHTLFNSGGVMSCPLDLLTKEGYDLQFSTNVLGHFYLTKLLLPILTHTSTTSPQGEKARVVTTSGSIYKLFPRISYDTLRDGKARRKLSSDQLYAQSKFGGMLFSSELARRHADGLVAIVLHPGVFQTGAQRHMNAFKRWMSGKLSSPVWMGALTQLYAGTDPAAAAMNGKYLIPWAREGRPSSEAKDEKEAEKLWNWLEEQVVLAESSDMLPGNGNWTHRRHPLCAPILY